MISFKKQEFVFLEKMVISYFITSLDHPSRSLQVAQLPTYFWDVFSMMSFTMVGIKNINNFPLEIGGVLFFSSKW